MLESDASPGDVKGDARQNRQQTRQRAIADAVMAEGAARIEQLAERFGISLMTVHRDLDELESRGLLRKSRGVATAQSSSLVESSDVYRAGQEIEAKRAIASSAIELIEPGQSLFLDDSTTVLQLAKLLPQKAPLTVITNVLTLMNDLNGQRGITLLGLGGTYYNWCSAFMGTMTIQAISQLRADVFIMSTAAITDDACFFQTPETVDTKRAMFNSAAKRILLTDHTKFNKRALHEMAQLRDFDTIIVDYATSKSDVARLREMGNHVIVAPNARSPKTT
ncbi:MULTISPECIES: DeoR/GlpR family DNA-binding transcription regulator [Humibacter]